MEAPPTTGDRFFVITDDDQRGAIWVVSIICCVYILMILVLRWSSTKGAFGVDDWLAAASTLAGLVQYIMIFVATARGLGISYTDPTPSQADDIGKEILVADIFVLITLCLGKLTVIYLCRRVFASSMKRQIRMCDGMAGICVLWALASILTISIDCSPLEQLGFRISFCTNTVTRWKAIGIADAVTEALIVALASAVIWPLQTTWHRKVVVIMHFVPRLLLAVFIALHVTSLEDARDRPARRNLFFTRAEIYLQLEVLYSIFSAAIPAVNRWLRSFDTSMGGTWTTSKYGSDYASDKKTSRTGGRDIRMNELKTATNISRTSNKDRIEVDREEVFRPEQTNYTAAVSGQVDPDAQSGQSHESIDSQSNIIRRETRWQVHHETRYEEQSS